MTEIFDFALKIVKILLEGVLAAIFAVRLFNALSSWTLLNVARAYEIQRRYEKEGDNDAANAIKAVFKQCGILHTVKSTCDGCGKSGGEFSDIAAARKALYIKGWTENKGELLCPECSALTKGE